MLKHKIRKFNELSFFSILSNVIVWLSHRIMSCAYFNHSVAYKNKTFSLKYILLIIYNLTTASYVV